MLYNFGRLVFAIYIRTVFRLRVHGLENLPGRKPFILCCNHISMIDPMTVGVAIPARYKIKYMAKSELFKIPVVSFLIRNVGAFPVNRREADYTAIKWAYRILEEGEVLGIFPEGTRSSTGDLQKAFNGAALIAVRSGVPILPMAIEGPYRFCKPLHVYIGKPFALPPLDYENKLDKRAQLDQMSGEIMRNISQLMTKKDH